MEKMGNDLQRFPVKVSGHHFKILASANPRSHFYITSKQGRHVWHYPAIESLMWQCDGVTLWWSWQNIEVGKQTCICKTSVCCLKRAEACETVNHLLHARMYSCRAALHLRNMMHFNLPCELKTACTRVAPGVGSVPQRSLSALKQLQPANEQLNGVGSRTRRHAALLSRRQWLLGTVAAAQGECGRYTSGNAWVMFIPCSRGLSITWWQEAAYTTNYAQYTHYVQYSQLTPLPCLCRHVWRNGA